MSWIKKLPIHDNDDPKTVSRISIDAIMTNIANADRRLKVAQAEVCNAFDAWHAAREQLAAAVHDRVPGVFVQVEAHPDEPPALIMMRARNEADDAR